MNSLVRYSGFQILILGCFFVHRIVNPFLDLMILISWSEISCCLGTQNLRACGTSTINDHDGRTWVPQAIWSQVLPEPAPRQTRPYPKRTLLLLRYDPLWRAGSRAYRLTQVFTGKRCFGEQMCLIRPTCNTEPSNLKLGRTYTITNTKYKNKNDSQQFIVYYLS